MKRKRKKLIPKSKDVINEATDIIRNTEDDNAAIAFLKDTLTDDYPDLDLGSMNLHEAINVLETKDKKASSNLVGSLNDMLGEFIDKQERKIQTNVAKGKKNKGRKKKYKNKK